MKKVFESLEEWILGFLKGSRVCTWWGCAFLTLVWRPRDRVYGESSL